MSADDYTLISNGGGAAVTIRRHHDRMAIEYKGRPIVVISPRAGFARITVPPDLLIAKNPTIKRLINRWFELNSSPLFLENIKGEWVITNLDKNLNGKPIKFTNGIRFKVHPDTLAEVKLRINRMFRTQFSDMPADDHEIRLNRIPVPVMPPRTDIEADAALDPNEF